TPRVSSPDVERAFPGPYESTSVTFAPIFRRFIAVKLPHAPAPMTTMSGDALADLTDERRGRSPGTLVAAMASEPPTNKRPAPAPATLMNSRRGSEESPAVFSVEPGVGASGGGVVESVIVVGLDGKTGKRWRP